MEIRLSLRDRRNALELDLGISFRLVFTAIAALLIGVWVTAGTLGLLGILILVVTIFGSIYSERWVFDGTDNLVRSSIGTIIIAKTRTWRFEEVLSIRALHYHSGTIPYRSKDNGPVSEKKRFFQREFVRYELVLTEGETVRIEMRRIHESEDPWQIPQNVADRIGVPLEKIHA